MSNLIENMRSVLELISSSFKELGAAFILMGFLLLSLGFLKLDGFKIISRDSTTFPPVILGVVLSSVGLLLFFRPSNNKNAKTIVFYAPTIRANSFFMELLDYSVERAKQKRYNFVLEKGAREEYHTAANYIEVITQYSGSKASNTVLIMIPPSPAAYDDIWKLDKDLKANLITLDMDIEESQDSSKYGACQFHKKVILVDNRDGAMLAANEIVSFCKIERIQAINVIICEGDFHARGQLFKTAIEKIAYDSSLEISFLGPPDKLSFSDAVTKAREYIQYVLSSATEDLKKKNTFIFCANDNMAIGARMGVSHISTGDLGSLKPIRIISFDASTFVKMHIDQNDPFFWSAVDQRYNEIVRLAIESAEKLFEGQKLTKDPIRVKPKIHKRYQDG
jgi:DNA-binding LacI/PurR family transcriptional regulator